MIEKLFITLMIFIWPVLGFASQASDLFMKNPVDTALIAQSIDQAHRFYNESEADSSLLYATQALSLSKQLLHSQAATADEEELSRIQTLTIESYAIFAKAYRTFDIKGAEDTLFAAMKYFQKIDDSEKGAIYSELGDTYTQMGQDVKALNYSNKALESFEASGDQYSYMHQLTSTGLILRNLGNYGESLEYFIESLNSGRQLNDSTAIVESLLAMGFVYMYVEKWSDAIDSQKEALKLYQAADNQWGIARIHNDMGVTYYRKGDIDSSLVHHRKALAMRLELNNSYDTFSSYSYIADILADQGDIVGAIEFYDKALTYGDQIAFKTEIVAANLRQGYNYLMLSDLEDAKKKFNIALELSTEVGDTTGMSRARMGLAQVAMSKDDYKNAIDYLLLAEQTAPESNLRIRESLYREIAETYYNLGDYKKAYTNSLIFSEVKDSALAAENLSQISRMTSLMEFENEMALKRENNEKMMAIKQAEINEGKFIRNIFLGGMIFAVILVGITFFRFIEKKKLSNKLNDTVKNLQSAQRQLIHSEKMASLGELTAGIAHEIKNPLNFVNNFAEVSEEMVDEAAEELAEGNSEEVGAILTGIRINLGKINHHGKRADSIIKGMLQHARGGSGKMEPTDVNALIKEFTNLAFHGMRAGKDPMDVDIELELDEKVREVDLIAEDFSRVIVNLCNNAFDAMREKQNSELSIQNSEEFSPKLCVRTRLSDSESIVIEIEDNGPGIPGKIKNNIMQPFFTTKKGAQGTGLGLSITNDIINAHGGSLDVESEPGKTVFKIILNV